MRKTALYNLYFECGTMWINEQILNDGVDKWDDIPKYTQCFVDCF